MQQSFSHVTKTAEFCKDSFILWYNLTLRDLKKWDACGLIFNIGWDIVGASLNSLTPKFGKSLEIS